MYIVNIKDFCYLGECVSIPFFVYYESFQCVVVHQQKCFSIFARAQAKSVPFFGYVFPVESEGNCRNLARPDP